MCGASNEQKSTYRLQNQAYKTSLDQAQQVFGDASSIFKDLQAAYAPIVAAGPNQHGFSLPEEAALKSKAIENEGNAYEHSRQVLKANEAASGGVGVAGSTAALDAALANQGARATANDLTDINIKNAEIGRDNFFRAGQQLSGATQVFSPATGAQSAANEAGADLSKTANDITQASNSWQNVVAGVLGGVTGNLISPGGMLNKGLKGGNVIKPITGSYGGTEAV